MKGSVTFSMTLHYGIEEEKVYTGAQIHSFVTSVLRQSEWLLHSG